MQAEGAFGRLEVIPENFEEQSMNNEAPMIVSWSSDISQVYRRAEVNFVNAMCCYVCQMSDVSKKCFFRP